jgi:hypothetical protein
MWVSNADFYTSGDRCATYWPTITNIREFPNPMTQEELNEVTR